MLNNRKKKIPVIINVDTGIDDCVAIGLAIFSDMLDLKLITCGAGNVGVDQATINTLNVLSMFNVHNIPVVKGENDPLKRSRLKLGVHGTDGMGNYDFMPHDIKPLQTSAHEAIKEVLLATEEKMVWIELGPMTNLAKFLCQNPSLKERFEKIIIMGGTIEERIKTQMPYPSFNVLVDPEAVDVVLSSGIPLVLVPSDMGHTAYLDYQDIYKTKNMNRIGEWWESLFRQYKDHHVKKGAAMHDSCAVLFAIKPEIFKIRQASLYMKYYNEKYYKQQESNTGILIIDFEKPDNHKSSDIEDYNKKLPPRHWVCVDVNVKDVKRLYFKALKRMNRI